MPIGSFHYSMLRTLFLFMEVGTIHQVTQLRLVAGAWRREFVGGFFPVVSHAACISPHLTSCRPPEQDNKQMACCNRKK